MGNICVGCAIAKVSTMLRTGVTTWEKIKPEIRTLLTIHGYNPTNDIRLAQLRAKQEAEKMLKK